MADDTGVAALCRSLRERFAGTQRGIEEDRGRVVMHLERRCLLEVLRALRDESAFGFEVLVDLTAVDRAHREPRFDVVYQLRAPVSGRRLQLLVPVPDADCALASVVPLWPAANWLERELWDFFGIRFSGHPDPRRLMLEESFVGHPLRKDHPLPPPAGRAPRANRMGIASDRRDSARAAGREPPAVPLLELEPWHPLLGGAFGLRIALDAQRIAGLEVRLGPLHRGFEKQCEGCSHGEALPWVDRLGETSGVAASLAYCAGVEALLEVEIPGRAQWLRVLAAELARLLDHTTRLARLARQLDVRAADAWMLEAREAVFDLMEALTGARVTGQYVCIGGVRYPLPDGFGKACRETEQRLRPLVRDYRRVLGGNRIFIDRLRGTGLLAREDALRHSLSGPLLRALGESTDLRKDEPYLVYEQIDFDVPVGTLGDNYDRYLVCLEEIEQSLRIVEQAAQRLEAWGPGPIRGPLLGGFDALEAVAGAGSGPGVPAAAAYRAVESADGELGFYLACDGSMRPLRVHCRAPSLFHLQALETMVRGDRLADLGVTLALLHVIGVECQR